MTNETETPDTETPETLDEEFRRLEAEIAEWKDHALRAAAEADNVRRRAEREMNDARAFAIQRFARDLFGVADNLQRALQAAPRDALNPALSSLVTGVELIEKSLLTAFESNGVKRIDPAAGERFDPNRHQAMMEEPAAEHAPGSVTRVLQGGYELFGRVLRPAMVAVAARTSSDAPGQNPYAKADGSGEGESVDTKA